MKHPIDVQRCLHIVPHENSPGLGEQGKNIFIFKEVST